MKEKYVLENSKGEFFSHFNEWQGVVHSNWTKFRIQTFATYEKAKEILARTFKECEVRRMTISDLNFLQLNFSNLEKQNTFNLKQVGNSTYNNQSVAFGVKGDQTPYIELVGQDKVFSLTWQELIELAFKNLFKKEQENE